MSVTDVAGRFTGYDGKSVFLRDLHFLYRVQQFLYHLLGSLHIFKHGSHAVWRATFAMPGLVKPQICLGVNIKSLIVVVYVLDKRVDVGTFHGRAERKVPSRRAEPGKFMKYKLFVSNNSGKDWKTFDIPNSELYAACSIYKDKIYLFLANNDLIRYRVESSKD